MKEQDLKEQKQEFEKRLLKQEHGAKKKEAEWINTLKVKEAEWLEMFKSIYNLSKKADFHTELK